MLDDLKNTAMHIDTKTTTMREPKIKKINLPCAPMSEILFGLKRKNCEADNDTSR